MIALKKIFSQSSHYFIGNIIIMMAGFISLPILTRIFSIEEYGLLGLINTTILVIGAIAKFGLQNSIIRYYQEYESKNRLSDFYSTFIFCSFFIAVIVCLIFYIISINLPQAVIGEEISKLKFLIIVVVLFRTFNDILTSFLRAEEKTKFYNLIQIIRRYGSLLISVVFVIFIIKGLYGFYLGHLIVTVSIFILMFSILVRQKNINVEKLSLPLFYSSVSFGFFLIWSELGSLLMHYLDRYLIRFFLGADQLGLYTVGYNLSFFTITLFTGAFRGSFEPLIIKYYVKNGNEDTKVFLSKIFLYFSMVIIPCAFGYIVINNDIVVLLASSKYSEASRFVPFITLGLLMYSFQHITDIGLFLLKKTHVIPIMMLVFCFLNVLLNIFLLPRFSTIGAAYATFLTYSLYTITATIVAFRFFSFKIPWLNCSLYIMIGALMALFTNFIETNNCIINLIAKICSGCSFYTIMLYVLDKNCRKMVNQVISFFRSAHA